MKMQNDDRDAKIFKSQCLNLAAQSLQAEGVKVIDNLTELFVRAEKIYAKGKSLKFIQTL